MGGTVQIHCHFQPASEPHFYLLVHVPLLLDRNGHPVGALPENISDLLIRAAETRSSDRRMILARSTARRSRTMSPTMLFASLLERRKSSAGRFAAISENIDFCAIKDFIIFSRSGLGNRAIASFSLPAASRLHGACFRSFLGWFLQHFINLSCCSFLQHLRQRYRGPAARLAHFQDLQDECFRDGNSRIFRGCILIRENNVILMIALITLT